MVVEPFVRHPVLLRAALLGSLLQVASGCAFVRRLPFVSPFEGPVTEVPAEAKPLGAFMQGQAARRTRNQPPPPIPFGDAGSAIDSRGADAGF